MINESSLLSQVVRFEWRVAPVGTCYWTCARQGFLIGFVIRRSPDSTANTPPHWGLPLLLLLLLSISLSMNLHPPSSACRPYLFFSSPVFPSSSPSCCSLLLSATWPCSQSHKIESNSVFIFHSLFQGGQCREQSH